MMEYEYPIYKKSKYTNRIIKFVDITKGIVVRESFGTDYTGPYSWSDWPKHTDTDIWANTYFREKIKFNYCLGKGL